MKDDLKNKIKEIIKEEVTSIVNENQYEYGGLLDPEDFDPNDPELHVTGFGTMTRSALRNEITKRIAGLYRSAKDAAGSQDAVDKYRALQGDLESRGVLMQLINAELEVAEQLEAMRTKGGRRAIPIPKQT